MRQQLLQREKELQQEQQRRLAADQERNCIRPGLAGLASTQGSKRSLALRLLDENKDIKENELKIKDGEYKED